MRLCAYHAHPRISAVARYRATRPSRRPSEETRHVNRHDANRCQDVPITVLISPATDALRDGYDHPVAWFTARPAGLCGRPLPVIQSNVCSP